MVAVASGQLIGGDPRDLRLGVFDIGEFEWGLVSTGHPGAGTPFGPAPRRDHREHGSSTRIEGSRLSDREVDQLLSSLEIQSFASRDEQEVVGYAQLMETVFSSWAEITVTENHFKQLHRDLLLFSDKDERHRDA